jgi:hypothetical protein
LHPIDNAVYSVQRSAATTIRADRKSKAPVFPAWKLCRPPSQRRSCSQVQEFIGILPPVVREERCIDSLAKGRSMPITLPGGITRFQDNDRGFFAWLESNPEGYFLNSERNPKPRYLVLDRTRFGGHSF